MSLLSSAARPGEPETVWIRARIQRTARGKRCSKSRTVNVRLILSTLLRGKRLEPISPMQQFTPKFLREHIQKGSIAVRSEGSGCDLRFTEQNNRAES